MGARAPPTGLSLPLMLLVASADARQLCPEEAPVAHVTRVPRNPFAMKKQGTMWNLHFCRESLESGGGGGERDRTDGK